MDAIDCIVKRRSIRKYMQKPVEFEKITAILEAGSYAPSSGNIQDFRFLLVTDKPLIKAVSEHAIGQYWIATAPVLIIVCALPERSETYYGLRGQRLYTIQNSAAAIENMLIAATALDLGSCWVGAFDEDKIKELFSIPENIRPQAIIAIGYADETPKELKRNPLTNLVYFNKYGLKIEKLHLVLKDYSVEWQRQAEEVKPMIERGVEKIRDSIKSIYKKKEETKEDNKEAPKEVKK